jgi:hypothetical protein
MQIHVKYWYKPIPSATVPLFTFKNVKGEIHFEIYIQKNKYIYL